ncbi:MAG: hypothetical protein JW731_17925 [Bacteroidales bacterium]|nr:hypothetical protein [Bacteroidales bacterium]
MKKSGIFIVFILLAAGLAILSSCEKNDAQEMVSKTSSKDYLALLAAFNLDSEEMITSGDENDLKSAESLGCLTVIIHENETGEFWPRSWTLDYGTENCETFRGNLRRGKIHFTLSDWWRNEGSFREITFEDYYFNNNKLEGTKTILNNGENQNGNLTFTRKVTDGKLVYANGTEMSWECEKQSEMVEGMETLVFADDVWSVTGSGSGINIDGKAYGFLISSPLMYKNGCFWPISGIVEISSGESLIVYDYGNGECDNKVTVTENGETETVEL